MTKGTPHQVFVADSTRTLAGRPRADRPTSTVPGARAHGADHGLDPGRGDRRAVMDRVVGRLASVLRALAVDFGNRDLGRLGVAKVGISFASWCFAISLGVYGFETGGAVAVGVVAAVRLAPGALASPFAGLLGDRFPRRNVLIGSGLAITAVLAAASAAAAARHDRGRLRPRRRVHHRGQRLRPGGGGPDAGAGTNAAGAFGRQRHPQRDGQHRLPARRRDQRRAARGDDADRRLRGRRDGCLRDDDRAPHDQSATSAPATSPTTRRGCCGSPPSASGR